MEALKGFTLSEGGLASVLLVALIISLFINLVFINNKLINKAKDKGLDKLAPSIIQKYLYSQAEKTLNSHKFHYVPKLHELVVKFRGAYLKIEAKCIDRSIDSKEYWNLLNAKLNELFKLAANYADSRNLLGIKKKIELIQSLVSESEKLIDKEKIFSGLDKFYEACKVNSDEGKALEYDKKLNAIILRLTNKYYARLDNLVRLNDEYIDSSKEAIGRLEDSICGVEEISESAGVVDDSVREQIARYKQNNKEIKEGVESYRVSLGTLETKLYAIKGAGYAGDSDNKMRETTKELSDLSEQIQIENEREIDRLKRIVKDQRMTIRDLEEKLKSILQEVLDSAASSKAGLVEEENRNIENDKNDEKSRSLIDLLTSNLQDAEHCIVVLENEIEALKRKTAVVATEFAQLGETEEPGFSVAEADSLQKEIEELRKQVEQKGTELEQLQTVANFSMEVFQSETIEDLSLLLYQTLSELKANVVLRVYAPGRKFDICSAGKIPPKLSTIIDNLQVNESSSNRNSVFFKFTNIGGAVQPTGEEAFSDEQVSDILTITKIANKMFDTISLLTKNKSRFQKIASCENQIKRASSEIDGAFDKICAQAVAAVEDSFRQMRAISRSAGLNATQVAKFNSIENAAIADIRSENRIKLKLKKTFLEALKELESVRH